MPRSSRRRGLGLAALLLAVAGGASPARAQQQPQGFAVERFYPSAAGGGWFVMDELDMHGGLRGAMSFTVGYEKNPLRIGSGAQRLAVVDHQAFASVGASVGYSRFRFYLDASLPIAIKGDSGTVGAYSFTGPSLDLGANPDPVYDLRLGADVRLFGGPRTPFRLGAGAQLFIPNGQRADYDTDHTFRGMFRGLFAGDVGLFTYAGHLGVHVRPLDDAPTPGSPHGSELLFGLAGGARLSFGRGDGWAVVLGPEIFGATAFRSFFGPGGKAFEGLLTGRFEGTADAGMQLRVKLGAGLGSNGHFGAPDSRVLVGIEIFNRKR